MSFLTRRLYGRLLRPSRIDDTRPEDVGLDAEEVFFPATDGLRLHGWWIPGRAGRGTILSCHGAGSTVGADLPRTRFLHDEGWSLFLFDYRGYGCSQGPAEGEGLWHDCRGALAESVRRHEGGPLVLLGRSLGAAMAMPLAAYHREIDRVVAVAPPPSLQEMTAIRPELVDRVGPVWAERLVRLFMGSPRGATRFAPLVAPTPLLVVQGEEDTVVPPELALRVYEAARDPKELVLAPDAGHDPLTESAVARERLLGWL